MQPELAGSGLYLEKQFYRTVSQVVPQHICFDLDHTLCLFDKSVFVCLRFRLMPVLFFVFVFYTVTTNNVGSSVFVSTMHASFFCELFLILSSVVRY